MRIEQALSQKEKDTVSFLQKFISEMEMHYAEKSKDIGCDQALIEFYSDPSVINAKKQIEEIYLGNAKLYAILETQKDREIIEKLLEQKWLKQ